MPIREVDNKEKNERIKFLAYVRGSREDINVQNQIFAIQRWAEKNRYEIVDIFTDEDVSGWKIEPMHRPFFKKIIEFSKNTGIKNIVFYSVDRLARNYLDGLLVVKYFKDNGYNYEFVNDRWLSEIPNPSFREFMLGFSLFVAQQYAESVSEKVKTAIARIKANTDILNIFDSGWVQGKLKTKNGEVPKRRKITPEIFEEIVKLRKHGYSWQAIAQKLGMKHKTTPYMAWKRTRERVLSLLEQGYRLEDIAEHSGVDKKALKGVIR